MTNDLPARVRFCRHYGREKNPARAGGCPCRDPCGNLSPCRGRSGKADAENARRSVMDVIRSPDGTVKKEPVCYGPRPKEENKRRKK